MKDLLDLRDKALNILKDRLSGFYLAGGTGLSLFYYQHRESFDLDFFTQDFSRVKINRLMKELSDLIKLDIELSVEKAQEDRAKVMVYLLKADRELSLKIDFIEDMFKLIKEPNIINGVPVLSLEDIYLRKIYAVSGVSQELDSTGRGKIVGGRQEAKDFFDLYFLSTTFMPLSKFLMRYCNRQQLENIIVWYRSYERVVIKLGLNELITDKLVDYVLMERHFKLEVAKVVEQII